eukprot:m.474175 g.474175  ORF g.474175 m.474175 type:complete len:699 (-) comp21672_c0_seq3:202-2298(-)
MALPDIRFKCAVGDGEAKVFLLPQPVVFDHLKKEILKTFGEVAISYNINKNEPFLIRSQQDLDEAIHHHFANPTRKGSIKLVLDTYRRHSAQATHPIGTAVGPTNTRSAGMRPRSQSSAALLGTTMPEGWGNPQLSQNITHRHLAGMSTWDSPQELTDRMSRVGLGAVRIARQPSPPPGSVVPHRAPTTTPSTHRGGQAHLLQPHQTHFGGDSAGTSPLQHRRNNSGSGAFVPSNDAGEFVQSNQLWAAKRGRNNDSRFGLSSSFNSGGSNTSLGNAAGLSRSFHGGGDRKGFFTRDEDTESGLGGDCNYQLSSLAHSTFPRESPKVDPPATNSRSYPNRKGPALDVFCRPLPVANSNPHMPDEGVSWQDTNMTLQRRHSDKILSQHTGAGDGVTRGSFSGDGSSGSSSSSARSSSHEDVAGNDAIVVGRWNKGRLLGSGAFGEVFIAYDPDRGVEFAVKQVQLQPDGGDTNEREVQAFEREISLLKTARHEHIVAYYGCERTSQHLAIFMEYVPGRSIHARLQSYGPFCEALVRKYTRQVLLGLQYLHAMKVIHRDIKGANVLINGVGDVKLADFGASKRLQSIRSLAGSKSMHGTPYWMSPESIIASSDPTDKSDIWSTAALVVEMLTQNPPFSDLDPMPALFHIGKARSSMDFKRIIPQGISEDASNFLQRCFKLDADERPDAKLLLQDSFVVPQ